jgi:DNA-nicking Smr family endonuclease
MSGPKKHPDKKSKITPHWEDEEKTTGTGHPSRPSAEEEAKLFQEAVKTGKIPRKDEEQTPSYRSITKKIERYDIDLHGLTVEEAQRHVVKAIEDILASAKGQTVNIRVITGKGHRSRGGEPQLIHSIHHVVEARFKSRLISIEVSPHELKIGDSYLKGHFDLKIR